MPFLRFSRDKRGYEHTYLVQATNRRGKAIRPRILYWYRTPPGVKLGRSPFDEDVRKTLEANNPGVTFDWATIVNTPFPPPDPAEVWRERRRIEKAARQARREEEREAANAVDAGENEDEAAAELNESEVLEAVDLVGEPGVRPGSDPSLTPLVDDSGAEPAASASADTGAATEPQQITDAADPASRKRRRRGGRRRRSRAPEPSHAAGPAEANAGNAADPGADSQNGESDADD